MVDNPVDEVADVALFAQRLPYGGAGFLAAYIKSFREGFGERLPDKRLGFLSENFAQARRDVDQTKIRVSLPRPVGGHLHERAKLLARMLALTFGVRFLQGQTFKKPAHSPILADADRRGGQNDQGNDFFGEIAGEKQIRRVGNACQDHHGARGGLDRRKRHADADAAKGDPHQDDDAFPFARQSLQRKSVSGQEYGEQGGKAGRRLDQLLFLFQRLGAGVGAQPKGDAVRDADRKRGLEKSDQRRGALEEIDRDQK